MSQGRGTIERGNSGRCHAPETSQRVQAVAKPDLSARSLKQGPHRYPTGPKRIKFFCFFSFKKRRLLLPCLPYPSPSTPTFSPCQHTLGPGMNFAVTRVWSAALDLVLPHTCPSCDQPVAARGLFCAPCFGRITLISKPFCRCCGVPFGSEYQAGRGGLCVDCASDRPEFERARAAFVYDAQSRGLVLGLKHADRTDLARTLAPFMVRAGGAAPLAADRTAV